MLEGMSDAESLLHAYTWDYHARDEQLATNASKTFREEVARRQVEHAQAVADYQEALARGEKVEEPKPYKAPAGDWVNWMCLAGRGWGKTKTGSQWIIEKSEVCDRMAIVAETAADARDVVVDGASGVMASSPPWNKPIFEPSKRRITWPNGSYATLYSGDDPEQLRGPQHSAAWVDELAKYRYAQELWNQLKFGMRIRTKDGSPPQTLITTTPKPLPILKKIIAHPRTITIVRSMYDNKENLDDTFLDEIREQFEGTTLGEQEIHAVMLDEAKGALWNRKMLEDNRSVDKPKDFWRETVIGVDPATVMKRNCTGIVCVSKGVDGHGYVRADQTSNYRPDQWGQRVAAMFEQFDADWVCAEGNQGGEMVRHVIHGANPKIPVKIVHARAGKQARAEPVAMLYEQGRMHHVGMFSLLETQQVTWEPESGDASPDRIDALVWAARSLFVTNVKPQRAPAAGQAFNAAEVAAQ